MKSTILSQTEQSEERAAEPDLAERFDESHMSRPLSGTVAREPRRVLFLDDDALRAEAFLIENPQAIWVKTVTECLSRLIEHWDEVHLDHDLGGKQFVDTSEIDCGMEVIRWLCLEPRIHLRLTYFFVHTHNTMAGLLMVLYMRANGYHAEFRPFGVDFSALRPGDEPNDCEVSDLILAPVSMPGRWLAWWRSVWCSVSKTSPSGEDVSKPPV